mmetsp:Transcript_48078/g.145196  ORF Transcript_48078/g.145196 Transcript_48078/m.145196 type:complete len:148 (-) Transcript_48078:1870-2313(-)
MNYAEDRLDRRSRTLEQEKNSCLGGKEGTDATFRSPPSDSLAEDLARSHKILRSAAVASRAGAASALGVERERRATFLDKLREGHELAGRTLRDCGLCKQATFHYAMAWMCDVDNDRSAGRIYVPCITSSESGVCLMTHRYGQSTFA